MKRFLIPLVALLALGLVAAGCGSDDEDAAGPATTATASESPSSEGSVPFDRVFIDSMVPHHESAIAMAQAALDAGLQEPELVKVANDIVETQQTEIDQLLAWREEWFGSGPLDPNAPEELGMSMSDMSMEGAADMLATSNDVDGDFAAMMIKHHESAIEMAEMAVEESPRPEIRELASAIIEAQKAEISVMKPYASSMEM